ncbi:uncharacterized protein LOC144198327 [Stigmatopora nigra]
MQSTTVVFLLSLQLSVISNLQCPKHQHSSLICTNDYNRIITCFWNCSDECNCGSQSACSIKAHRIKANRPYKSTCLLQPVDVSVPSAGQACSLIFGMDGIFSSYHELKVQVNCSNLEMSYRPSCHVKLPPPGKPQINWTIISWEAKHAWMSRFDFQLEWKLADEPWNGASVHRELKSHNQSQLSLDQLIRGAKYEARVRVKSTEPELKCLWSDWSTPARWTSDVGVATQLPANPLWLVMGVTISGIAFTVFLAILLFKTDKTTWLYTFRKIRGPPLPDPGKSFLQNVGLLQQEKKWASPPFSTESLKSFMGPVDILLVKSVDCVEDGCPGSPLDCEGLQEKIETKTSKVNSQQWLPPPPLASLTSRNLKQCAPNSPYAPIRVLMDQVGETNDIRKLLDVLDSFTKENDKATLVISDYEEIEKHQSQPLGEDEESGNQPGDENRSLFGQFLTEGSIELSLDYECIHTAIFCADGSELLSADSSRKKETEGLEESLEEGEIEAPILLVKVPQCVEVPVLF